LLSYHGNENQLFIDGKDIWSDEKVRHICSNYKVTTISTGKKGKEVECLMCLGHKNGDYLQPSFHGNPDNEFKFRISE
jgi:hypothetical protein